MVTERIMPDIAGQYLEIAEQDVKNQITDNESMMVRLREKKKEVEFAIETLSFMNRQLLRILELRKQNAGVPIILSCSIQPNETPLGELIDSGQEVDHDEHES